MFYAQKHLLLKGRGELWLLRAEANGFVMIDKHTRAISYMRNASGSGARLIANLRLTNRSLMRPRFFTSDEMTPNFSICSRGTSRYLPIVFYIHLLGILLYSGRLNISFTALMCVRCP